MKTKKNLNHKIITAVYLCVVTAFTAVLAAPMYVHAEVSQEAKEAGRSFIEQLVAAYDAAYAATEGTDAEKMAAAINAGIGVSESVSNSGKHNGWNLYEKDARENAYYNLETAQEVFTLINEERAAAGIPELVWDDTAYTIAMQRCYENDDHDSMRTGTSENMGNSSSAENIHRGFHDSQGHHDNYMNSQYNRGAVAVLQVGETRTVVYEVFFYAGRTYSMALALPTTTDIHDDPFQVTDCIDPVYYAQTYPDVAAAVGTDTEALRNHYLTCGKDEGRFPNALAAYAASTAHVTNTANASDGQYAFDPVFYAQTYPDVAAALGTDAEALYNHYITCGMSEGRFPNALAANGQ